jgi:hypothetical protein
MAIQKLDDPVLREFYLFLYMYLHGKDNDFNYLTEHLKKKIKVYTNEKYHKYSE